MRQAVILAGGKGTRLAERLNGAPKPLVPVDGVPLLRRQIDALVRHGIEEVVLLVNHAADQIATFVEALSPACVVRLIDDGDPRGTAGAVLARLNDLDDEFLVIYGDTLFDIDLDHMVTAHRSARADVTLLVHPNDHPIDSDLVELDGDGRVIAFHSYPHPPGSHFDNLVNAALYCVRKAALVAYAARVATPCDFAKDLFPAMVSAGNRLFGLRSFEYIKDIGTPARLDRAESHLRSGAIARAARRNRQKAVFVDRDGTLNQLRGYIRRPADLELIEGAADAVRALNAAEYRVVVVTNQPVVARGEASEDDLRHIHAKLTALLGEQGALIDALYYCPHHPHGGYIGEVAALKVACDCRKPGIGLFSAAIEDFNIDPARSWVVGDTTSDIAAGRALGARTVLVETGEGGRDGKYDAAPHFMATDIKAAAALIIDRDAASRDPIQAAA